MDSPKYLVVITLVEGQNFTLPDCVIDKSAQATVFAEARFDNEPLRSDPVKLTSTNPEFVTELAWQLDRRSLHQFRIERRAIKLQVFLQTSPIKKSSKDGSSLSPTVSDPTLETNQTHLVGYTIIDIRTAQERSQQKFEWRPLLNPKFRKPSYSRPEIQLAVSLIKCEEIDQEVSNGYKEAPYTLRFQKADVDSSLIAANYGNVVEYSDESFDDDAYDQSTNSLYKTCIDYTTVGNEQVNPHIAIIENDIKIRVLDGRHFIYDAQDNSTIEECKTFFTIDVSMAFISDLEALLLGHTRSFIDSSSKSSKFYFTFSLFGSSLKSDEFTISECNLKSKTVKFSVATTNVRLLSTYFTLNSTLDVKLYNTHKKVLGFTAIQMDQLCCGDEDDLQNGRSIEGMFSLQSCADNTVDNSTSPGPTVGIAVILTQNKSLDVLSDCKQRSMLKSPTAKNFELLSSLRQDSKTTVRDNSPETSEQQNHCISEETRSNQPSQAIDTIQTTEAPFDSFDDNQIRHYCFTIDLKTLTTQEDTNIDLASLSIRYSYSFFGYTDTITTDSCIPIDSNEAMIPHGFCEFNFATTSESLKYAFMNVPLLLEIVINRRSKAIETETPNHDENDLESVGISTVKFADLFDIDRLKISEEKCTMTSTTILGCDKSELGEVQLYLSLKDLGPTRINQDIIHETNNTRTKGSSLNERVNFVTDIDKLLIDASNEIESWKDQQLLSFKNELEQKEQEYLSNITHKLEAKETKRDAELKKKMSDLNKLERKLRNALLTVESKEKHLDQKEQQLLDKDKELSAKLATIDSELARAIEEVKLCHQQRDIELISNRGIYNESHKVKTNNIANGISQPIRVARRSSLRDQTAVSSRSPGIPLPVRSTSLVRGSIEVQSSKLPFRFNKDGKTAISVGGSSKIPNNINSRSSLIRPGSFKSMVTKDTQEKLTCLRKERADLLKKGCKPNDNLIIEINTLIEKLARQ